ncbi:MAG: ribbon-helix-helix protein, CopG family [Bilophila sp.]
METLTVATSFRAEKEKLQRLDALAVTMGRSRNWLVNEALNHFLAYHEWFLAEVQEGIAAADRGEFAAPEEVDALFHKYGAR